MTMRLENRVRELRQNCHLTQQQLAAAVGVTRQTIIAIERGGYTPSVELALKLAATFSCPLEMLFWLQEEKQRRM
jgi:putative transcriptional regulator